MNIHFCSPSLVPNLWFRARLVTLSPKHSLLAKQLVLKTGALLVVSESVEQPMGIDAFGCM